MRLWSIHPKYLDRQGLLAGWREGLLAQKVLAGKTKGYKNHPQLIRFRALRDPMLGIGSYLYHIAQEATQREYEFDFSKIIKKTESKRPLLAVTRGQLKFESIHLLKKVKKRNPHLYPDLVKNKSFQPHPIFKVIAGDIEDWEIR